MNYYNEWDPQAAAWLRELIKAGHIPQGIVDERSITEVTPADLAGFAQCHFFAGIGGWSRALQLAGVPATVPLWTGSPPCQPFSVAGAQVGFDDPRHLAPALLELIAQCRPPVVFGEQVSAAIGKHWLDFIFIDLEAEGYTCGAAVLPAASVGAPHKRDRLFFGATLRLGDTASERQCTDEAGQHRGAGQQLEGAEQGEHNQHRCADGSMADADDAGSQGWVGVPECAYQQPAGAAGVAISMAEPDNQQQRPHTEPGKRNKHAARGWDEDTAASAGFCGDRGADPHNGFWSDADWLGCRDGKFRPVEPGSFPLVNALPRGMGHSGDISLPSAEARVMRLRGYGNAIVPGAAAQFIKAFLGLS